MNNRSVFKPFPTMILKKIGTLTRNQEMSIASFIEHCGLSRRDAVNYLKRLTKHGFLVFGTKRGLYACTPKLMAKLDQLRREDEENYAEEQA